MAAETFFRIREVGAGLHIRVWIVACDASKLLALSETAAGHQSDGSKANADRIFYLRLRTRPFGRREAMAFAAHLYLRTCGKPLGIHDTPTNSLGGRTRFCCRYVCRSWTVTALSRNAGEHALQIRT